MDKVEQINQRKKKAADLVQRIDQAKQEYAYAQSKCKNVSDVNHFSRCQKKN